MPNFEDQFRWATEQVKETGKRSSFILGKQFYKQQIHFDDNPIYTPRRAKVILSQPIFNEFVEHTEQLAITINQTREKIQHAFSLQDKSGIHKCLREPFHADAFAEIVYEEVINSTLFKHSQLYFALGGPHNEIKSWVETPNADVFWKRVMKILNRGRVDCSIALGSMLEIKPEYCFSCFPIGQQKKLTGASEVINCIPNSIKADGLLFKLYHNDIQKAINGNTIYSVCQYKAGKQNIFLMACCVKYTDGTWRLKIGFESAPTQLLSHDLIVANPNAHVVICTDMNIASRFRLIAKECQLLQRTNVILSGFVGGMAEAKNYPLSCLYGHPVTIISPPGLIVDEALDTFGKNCINAGASETRLFPLPIFTDEGDYDFSLFKPEKMEEVINNSICLNGHYAATNLIEQIMKNSIKFEEKTAWAIEFLKSSKTSCVDQKKIVEDNALKFFTFDQLSNGVNAQIDTFVEMGAMFSPQYATLIWGQSNAGKSWVGIQQAIALATGTACFMWEASTPAKVGYFDCEIGDDFKERLKKLHPDVDNDELFKKNFHLIKAASDFDFLDKKFQQDFIDRLKSTGIEYLFIDNLLSLAEKVLKNNMAPYFNFVEKLKQNGISVITIHHANKSEDEYKGPVDLEARHQNVIRIDGHNQLDEKIRKKPEEFSSEDLDVIQAALSSEDRVIIQMTITKTKVAANFEGKPFLYKLPLNGGWEAIGTGNNINTSGNIIEEDQEIQLEGLNTNEQKVYQYFLENPEKLIKNADIQGLLGLKEGACLNILRTLSDKKLINKFDKGINTRYKLRKSS